MSFPYKKKIAPYGKTSHPFTYQNIRTRENNYPGTTIVTHQTHW